LLFFVVKGAKDITLQNSLASVLSRRSKVVLDDEEDEMSDDSDSDWGDDDDDDEGSSSITRSENITSSFFTVRYLFIQ